MKKKLIMVIATLCFSVLGVYAGFNKTYTLDGYKLFPTSTALLNKNSTRDVVFCASGSDTTTSFLTRCFLVKTDSNGNFMQAFMRDTSNGAERIIETADSGILLVSEFMFHTQVTKFDNNLMPVWWKDIAHPYCFSTISGSIWDIDIERVMEKNVEMYYIVYNTGDVAYSQDLNMNLLKIDENGNVQWRKRYFDINRAFYGNSSNSSLMDKGHSITSLPDWNDPNNTFFAIAGMRDIYDDNLNHTTTLFTITVDENGNIMNPYQDITTGDQFPSAPDILWDGDSLVMTYIEKNFGNYDPSTASGLGLLKFDNMVTSMRGNYYWQECENYGLSIAVASDNNYVIGGFSSSCVQGPGYQVPTSLALKLNRTGLNQIYYRKYNLADALTVNSFHKTDDQDANYLLSGINHPYGIFGTPGNDLRAIKTTANGLACGFRNFNMNVDPIEPSITTQEYVYDEELPVAEIPPNWFGIQLTERDCKNSAGADGYKATSVSINDFIGISASVSPTFIARGRGSNIQCVIESKTKAPVTITACNALGQVVYKGEYEIHAGKNSYSIKADVLSRGLNVIRITSGSATILSEKVIAAE